MGERRKRVYVSGAITGEENYKEHFARGTKALYNKGFEVVNPAIMDFVLPSATYEEYMKIDLQLLDMCDAIYMLNNWESSRGANREYGYALAKGMEIMYEPEATGEMAV